MIDFYGLTSPNVQKIFIMLEECGLQYKFIPVDVWAAAQHTTDFSKINPNKKIPAIVDHDGPGGKPYTVFESGAILMYLAEKTGKFLPKDMAKKYDVIQWLFIQVAGVGPAFGNFTHFNLFAPKQGNEYSYSRYKTEMLRLYDLIEERLGKVKYLGGNEYSIADMACYPWIVPHAAHGQDLGQFPHLRRWFETIRARPATARTYAGVEDVYARTPALSADARRVLFGSAATAP